MVVCKFFQQGSCRYGQNCRFEHIYGSKYSYQATQPVQASGVTDEQLVNQVQSDVQSALKGGQWLLSCYAPFKEKPVFPGIHDLSPEEARLCIYEAKANNNVDQAVSFMNNLFKETRQKFEQLLQPNPSIITVLRSLYKGETVSSPFTNTHNTTYGNTAASSVFRSAVQNTGFSQNNATPSMFNQKPDSSIFRPQHSDSRDVFSKASQNVFGPNSTPSVFANETGAKSIFAQANQSAFSPNTQTDPSSIFASAHQSTKHAPSSIFATANQSFFGPKDIVQNTSVFSQNVFQRSENQPSNVFGQNAFHKTVDDAGVYSKLEDLSAEDLEEFQNDSFRLGFVPENAPPQTLCN